MTRAELWEAIRNGESSQVGFTRDGIRAHELAKHLVAFLNVAGGSILLGVDGDGTISGVRRDRAEEWVEQTCRTRVEPAVIPILSWVRDASPGRHVLVIQATEGPDKPYARMDQRCPSYYVRLGRKSRESSREELQSTFPRPSGRHYGLKPVPGARLEALDRRRLQNYLRHVLGGSALPDDDLDGWERLLTHLEFMTTSAGQAVATVSGILLFGRQPNRFLPQAGVRAIRYPGPEADYATQADEELRGPMAPLRAADGSLVESGWVEQTLDFVRRNTHPTAKLVGGRRVDRWEYPLDVVREVVVNALVHRDYTIAGSDITLTMYSDRLEVKSPGVLPNIVTIEGMRAGVRYARNQTLVNVMRDYDYVEGPGMGVRTRIIPGMKRHNGTEPDLIEQHHGFTVRLWRDRREG